MAYISDYNNTSRLRNELKKVVISGQGRKHTDRLVELLKKHPEWHNELINIYLSNEEPFSRKIVWAIDLYSERNPDLVLPYLQTIADLLPRFSHDGLRRHSLHILSRLPLPADKLGILISTCFDWLLAPHYPAAIKVCCMELLYRISNQEAELRKELADCIEFRLSEETPGFKNRALKILRKLSMDMDSQDR